MYEKISNIMCRQGTANQTHKLPLGTVRMTLTEEKK